MKRVKWSSKLVPSLAELDRLRTQGDPPHLREKAIRLSYSTHSPQGCDLPEISNKTKKTGGKSIE